MQVSRSFNKNATKNCTERRPAEQTRRHLVSALCSTNQSDCACSCMLFVQPIKSLGSVVFACGSVFFTVFISRTWKPLYYMMHVHVFTLLLQCALILTHQLTRTLSMHTFYACTTIILTPKSSESATNPNGRLDFHLCIKSVKLQTGILYFQ